MTVLSREMLAALCRYSAYANGLVLVAAAGLSDDDFEAEMSPSRGSVGGLLRHMLSSDIVWTARCRGQEPQIDAARLAARADVPAYWAEVERERLAFVEGCAEADLARAVATEIQGQRVQLPVWQMLLQAFLHATHHRGELSIVLTELGHPLPTLDVILQFVQEGEGDPVYGLTCS
jgi:uncharacterized damage-inducible protein DinB